ncbi:MAG TPA: phage baseplate assembly protein V [Gaiellaceae bacterium]|nr:phage baseplate assembly protein V [Gaiellaceae bacterium]
MPPVINGGGQYFGKYSAVVKDNSDAQKLGTVKVSVPTLFPENELMDARAALPFGWFFIPENEAPVWVEFEGGDSTLPLWTGMQSLSGKYPSELDLDPPQKRALKTAAGHLILFDDKSGEELIRIVEAVHSHEILLDQNGIKVTDGVNNQTLTFDSSGVKASLQSGASVTITSSGITVDAGSGSLTLKGTSIELQGTSINLNGSSVKLGSAAALPVIRIGDMGTGNLGAPVPITGPGSTQVLA